MAHPIPTAKTAIKAALAARPAWSGVDIRDGQPTETEDVERSAFWFEPTETALDNWAWIGGLRRRVEFRLGFTIAVIREGDDERSTEDAMWTLFEDFLAAVKASPTFGDVVQQVEDVAGVQANVPMPDAWRATFTGSIAITSKPY